jgi:hypothetical protein
MARQTVRGNRQGDLFGFQPVADPSRRRTPAGRPKATEPLSPMEFANHATRSDLGSLVAGLGDEELTYLALACTRALKRRLFRSRRQQRERARTRTAELLWAGVAEHRRGVGRPSRRRRLLVIRLERVGRSGRMRALPGEPEPRGSVEE